MEWMAAASSGPALGFLRRLLCANTAAADTTASSPTRPEEGGRSPCIVARLMGLDAMPAAGAQLPRRARSSLRDKPAYLRPENDAFLLLSFSPEERGTGRESADDVGAERRRKLRFGGRGDEAGSSSPSSSGSGRRECNTQQSSSPVSVLDERDESSTATSSSLEDVEPCSATSASDGGQRRRRGSGPGKGQRAGQEVNVDSLSHYLEMGFSFLKVGGGGGNSEDGDGEGASSTTSGGGCTRPFLLCARSRRPLLPDGYSVPSFSARNTGSL